MLVLFVFDKNLCKLNLQFKTVLSSRGSALSCGVLVTICVSYLAHYAANFHFYHTYPFPMLVVSTSNTTTESIGIDVYSLRSA